MSVSLKIGSLFIRTLAKPIANGIKRNAREHEWFRRRCITMAQFLHRLDVRWRVGLLQDPALIEKQIQREVAEAEARRKRAQIPSVKTEAEMKEEEERLKHERESIVDKHKKKRPHVRPLTEAKAIDMGANFLSEGFLFLVAGGVILFESWRSRRKASGRRDEVDEKLEELQDVNKEMERKIQMLESKLAAVLPPEAEVSKSLGSSKSPDPNSSKESTLSEPPSAESSPKSGESVESSKAPKSHDGSNTESSTLTSSIEPNVRQQESGEKQKPAQKS